MTAHFDRAILRKHRERASRLSRDPDFLTREVSERLYERIEETNRHFGLVLNLGCGRGSLTPLLTTSKKIDSVVATDLAIGNTDIQSCPAAVADEEAIPFGAKSFDAILSSFALHWVNDLPGCLAQIRYALKSDGLFLAALAGGQTLQELRWALTQAEIEVKGGAGPRVAPFVDIRDAAALLQRARFDMPMADIDRVTIRYQDPFRLFRDLRVIGETNCLVDRPREPLSREVFARTLDIYREQFGNGEGGIIATFDIVYLTGWKPRD